MMYHVDRFVNIEPPLYSRNKSYLIVVNDFFNVLLELGYEYFVGDFCIYVHQRYCL